MPFFVRKMECSVCIICGSVRDAMGNANFGGRRKGVIYGLDFFSLYVYRIYVGGSAINVNKCMHWPLELPCPAAVALLVIFC